MIDVTVTYAVLLLLISNGFAGATNLPSKDLIPLDVKGPKVGRQESAESQIGLTSTSVFYAVETKRVVVTLHIDNAKKDFPVSGKVCRFAKDVSPEGMAKWVNNQHSCARFPDAPTPQATVPLPADACRSLQGELLGQKTVRGTTYNEYRVEIAIADFNVNDQYRLQAFTDTVSVYVQAQ